MFGCFTKKMIQNLGRHYAKLRDKTLYRSGEHGKCRNRIKGTAVKITSFNMLVAEKEGKKDAQNIAQEPTTSTEWIPIVATFTAGTTNVVSQYDIYVNARANTGTNTTDMTLAGALQYLMIGDIPGSTGLGAADPNQARIAHVAMWGSVLSASDIDAFMAGDNPSTIDASNLLVYFPMTADADKSHGSDSVTDLTVTNAVLDTESNPPVNALGFVVVPNPAGMRV
jgi:hypothetical protein